MHVDGPPYGLCGTVPADHLGTLIPRRTLLIEFQYLDVLFENHSPKLVHGWQGLATTCLMHD